MKPKKRNRTAIAVRAVLKSRRRLEVWKEIHPNGHPDEWPAPKVMTVYAAAKRFGLDQSGLARAVKHAERFQVCSACKGKGEVRRNHPIKLAD